MHVYSEDQRKKIIESSNAINSDRGGILNVIIFALVLL
jgi:hypothetical protein